MKPIFCIFIVLVAVIVIAALALFIQDVRHTGIWSVAESSPDVYNFSDNHTIGQRSLVYLTKSQVEADSDFRSKCMGLGASDYWKAMLISEDGKSRAVVFLYANTKYIACSFTIG